MTSRCSKGPLLLVGLVFFWAALGGLGLTSATPTPRAKSDKNLALDPQGVSPAEYFLDLQVISDATKPSYNLSGRVTITFTCRNATDTLNLSIDENVDLGDHGLLGSTLTGDEGVPIVRYPPGTDSPFVTLNLPKTLKVDHSYTLKFNISRLVAAEPQEENYFYHVALLMRPGHAHQFFPVFNSSNYKATFEVNVTHQERYHSLSAARVLQRIKVLQRPRNVTDGDWVLSAFEKSRPITVNQFAILVADLKFVNETSIPRGDGDDKYPAGWESVVQRIWSRPNFARATVTASELLPMAVCHIQCYIGVPFPSNTLDVVALPHYSDVPIVAATNAIFRESDLQHDPNMDGLMLRLARVVAEQYLGVLATPEPEPEARALSEALSNYVASETVRLLQPRESPDDREKAIVGGHRHHAADHSQGATDGSGAATTAAANAATPPPTALPTTNKTCYCEQYETDKSDLLVNALYSVYYELGSQFPLTGMTSAQRPALQGIKTELIMRMLAITLGENAFKLALKTLVVENSNGFFSSKDVWKNLNQAAHQEETLKAPADVEAIVKTWLDRDRFPLLTVQRDDHDNSAKLTQSVFRRRNYTPEERDLEKENAMVWSIPVTTLTEGQAFKRSGHLPRMWMTERAGLLLNASLGDSYLVVNPEETAPCIVNYDKRNWELLSNALNDRKAPELPPRTRAKLLHDAVMLAHAGAMPFSEALPLLRSLERETSPAVWMPIGNVLDHVRRDVEGTRIEDRFTAFLESILRGAMRNVNDRLAAKDLCECEARQLYETRALILQQLARADMQPCIKEARKAYEDWAASESPDEGKPMPDSLMCCLFQWGEDKEFEFGVQRLVHLPETRQRAERAFLIRVLAGCPRAASRKERIMNITLLENNGTFSEEDQRLVLQMVSARGSDLLNFLDVHWDQLKSKYESQPFMWEHLVSRASGSIKSHPDLKKLKSVFEKRAGSWGIADGIIQQAVRRAESNVAWADEAFPSMETWLEKYLVNIKKE